MESKRKLWNFGRKSQGDDMTSSDRRGLKGCKSIDDQHNGSFVKRSLPANNTDARQTILYMFLSTGRTVRNKQHRPRTPLLINAHGQLSVSLALDAGSALVQKGSDWRSPGEFMQ